MKSERTRSGRWLPALVVALMLSALVCTWAAAGETGKASGDFDTTEALIELLKEKGVINDTEAKGFMKRHKEQARSTGQIITISSPDDQEVQLKQISKHNIQQVTEDLNNLKDSYEYRSQDLIQKNILLEREVERLEEIITEEQLPAIQKSSWAQRIRFGGDIRIRHESVLFAKDNADNINDPSDPGASNYINSTNDKHRQRIRLRFGVKAKLLDKSEKNVGKVEAGLRVATGTIDNPVSTNHTMGHKSESGADIVLDKAYVKWTWKPEAEIWVDKLPQVSVLGGVFSNPWLSSSLVWDSDLSFEGLSASFRTDTLKRNPFAGFLTLGYFPLEESEWTQDNKYMVGGQLGFEHRPRYGWEYKLAAAYYDYNNVTAFPVKDVNQSPTTRRLVEAMSPKYMQMGNSTFRIDNTTLTGSQTRQENLGLLADFKILNISGRLENSLFYPIQIQLYWDWVKNLGYDAAEMAEKAGTTELAMEEESGDTGYQLGLKVGHPKPRQRWEWNLSMEYRYLESDAVLDAFTDSDFHLGGTNAKGWIFGGELGIYDNIWLKARWMTSNEITNMQRTDTKTDDLSVDTVQIDVNTSF